MIEAILTAAKLVGVNSQILLGICSVESDFRNVINYNDGDAHSYGPCQIKLGTAKLFNSKVTVKHLMDVKLNAFYAALYLKHQLIRYKGDKIKAIGAYNSGTYTIKNKSYVNKVLKRIKEF